MNKPSIPFPHHPAKRQKKYIFSPVKNADSGASYLPNTESFNGYCLQMPVAFEPFCSCYYDDLIADYQFSASFPAREYLLVGETAFYLAIPEKSNRKKNLLASQKK